MKKPIYLIDGVGVPLRQAVRVLQLDGGYSKDKARARLDVGPYLIERPGSGDAKVEIAVNGRRAPRHR